jgi:hypothetical protein
MRQTFLFTPLFLLAVCSGCAETKTETTAPATAASSGEPAKVALTDADRKAIEVQKVCPVQGEPLGSMGEPIKVTVKGRDVYLCCEGCRDPLLADPDKFLAKLDAPQAEAEAPPAAAAETAPAEKPAEAATPGT